MVKVTLDEEAALIWSQYIHDLEANPTDRVKEPAVLEKSSSRDKLTLSS